MRALFVALTVAVAGIMVACGAGTDAKKNVPQGVTEDVPPSELAQVKPQFTPPNKAARLNDIRLEISKAKVGTVPLEGPFANGSSSKDDLLAIHIKITSLNKTRKLSYHSWAGQRHLFDAPTATLTDNHRNSYKHVGFGLGVHPLGSIERNDSIYPETPITDIIVFEKPIKNAEYLDLTLPLKNLDTDGEIRFRIPMSYIIGRPESEPAPVPSPKPNLPVAAVPMPTPTPETTPVPVSEPKPPVVESTPPPLKTIVTVKPISGEVVFIADARTSYELYEKSTADARKQLISLGRVKVITAEIEGEKERNADDFIYFKVDNGGAKGKTWIVKAKHAQEAKK